MSKNLVYKTEKRTDEQLKQAWENAREPIQEIPVEYTTETGETEKQTLNMAKGLYTTLEFWTKQPLPEIPEIFVPNSETITPAASELEEPIDQ